MALSAYASALNTVGGLPADQRGLISQLKFPQTANDKASVIARVTIGRNHGPIAAGCIDGVVMFFDKRTNGFMNIAQVNAELLRHADALKTYLDELDEEYLDYSLEALIHTVKNKTPVPKLAKSLTNEDYVNDREGVPANALFTPLQVKERFNLGGVLQNKTATDMNWVVADTALVANYFGSGDELSPGSRLGFILKYNAQRKLQFHAWSSKGRPNFPAEHEMLCYDPRGKLCRGLYFNLGTLLRPNGPLTGVPHALLHGSDTVNAARAIAKLEISVELETQ
jgi:hypothetical protein